MNNPPGFFREATTDEKEGERVNVDDVETEEERVMSSYGGILVTYSWPSLFLLGVFPEGVPPNNVHIMSTCASMHLDVHVPLEIHSLHAISMSLPCHSMPDSIWIPASAS